jgi:beta-lactamase regulating signal transducer with metallopeptidase domain
MIGWAIEALIASAGLMLLVLVIRVPVRRAFGPNIAYALWVLPVARLLLPPLPTAWRDAATAPIAHASAGITVLVVQPLGLDSVAATTPVQDTPSLVPILLAVWAAGAAAFLIWHGIAHARFCRRIMTTARKVVSGPVNVIETDAATGPLAFGIWRKYVAFPGDFNDRYDADERDLALEHELTHHARGDLIANWVALVVLALHWFNPIAWRSFRAFRADQEMACDARVLADRDPAFRHAYGRAIVKSAHGGAVSAACHLHTINDLKGRLKMLSMGRKSRGRVLGGGVSVAALTLAALGLTASGTQAAERLRTRVGETIAVNIATLDAAIPAAIAPQVVGAMQAIATPVPPPTVPTAPPAPVVPGQAVATPVPPVPPAPEAMPATPAGTDNMQVSRQEWVDKDGKHHVVMIKRRTRIKSDGDLTSDGVSADDLTRAKHDGTPIVSQRVIVRDRDGKTMTDDMKGMADMPEISSTNCPSDGNPHQTVINGNKNGKRTIVICTNRIEKITENAARIAANSKDIERNAYRSALTGLRNARADMALKGNNEALKAIDQAIAEIESDLAKVN